jgi:hypothetical protein
MPSTDDPTPLDAPETGNALTPLAPAAFGVSRYAASRPSRSGAGTTED